jgi:hypothetical protein
MVRHGKGGASSIRKKPVDAHGRMHEDARWAWVPGRTRSEGRQDSGPRDVVEVNAAVKLKR